MAVSDVCTHQGCLLSYVASQQILSCPCHGAQFGEDGRVLRGSATRSLRSYTAQLVDNEVVVYLA